MPSIAFPRRGFLKVCAAAAASVATARVLRAGASPNEKLNLVGGDLTMSILLTAILTAPLFACGADSSDVGHRRPPTTIVFLGGCKTHAFYCKILFRPADQRVRPILTALLPPERPEKQIIGWASERADGGRAFACTGPHYHASWQNEDFRRLALNAILWTAKVDVPGGGVQSTVSPLDF